jgi:hypothetical protein
MNIVFEGFDWDEGNQQKCRKHGVSIAEIETLLMRGQPTILPDLKHSDEEERFLAMGRNDRGRGILVAFTLRQKLGQRLLRPISVRYMHQEEVDYYEKTNSRF